MKDLKDNLIAVIRVRGRVNVRHDIQETLDRLHLKKPNNCIILKANSTYSGMINKAKDYITYGEIEQSVLEKLFKKHKINLKVSEIIESADQAKKLKKYFPIKLHPPRHGYEPIKQGYKAHGALGYRGKDINKLILKMI